MDRRSRVFTSARAGAVALFALVLLLSLPQAALLPLLDRDEPRFAEASREMLQSGNFVVPTFNGAPRYAKPPLIYWTQAASFLAFGENAFAARLPSLLATAGTAALLLAWAAELGEIGAGWIAGLAYAFCVQTIQQGRAATADALLIFFITLTGYAGWKLLGELKARGSRAWCTWGGMLALGLAGGFLAKGPEALLPFLPLAWMARRGGARVLLALAAILALALLVVSCWAIPAYLQTHGAYWREGLGHDVGDRMVSGFQGHGASSLGWYLLLLPLYFVTFWLSALPWSALVLHQQRRLFTWRQHDEIDVYLLLNAGIFFAVFSLMVTKLPHYTLPAFPFLALLFAKRWCASGLPPWVPIKVTLYGGIALAFVALVGIPLFMLPRANPSPTGELVRAAGPELTPDTKFAVVDFEEPNTVWEMRRVARGYAKSISREKISEFLGEPGRRAVLLTSGAWQGIGSTEIERSHLKVFTARGWNWAKWSSLDLTLAVKEK